MMSDSRDEEREKVEIRSTSREFHSLRSAIRALHVRAGIYRVPTPSMQFPYKKAVQDPYPKAYPVRLYS